MRYDEQVTLALRRFEMVVVFLLAAVCAYAAATWYFGWKDGLFGPVTLIPQPQVLNQREALLRSLTRSSNVSTTTEEERLHTLAQLHSSSTPLSTELRLQVLQQLSRH